MNDISPQPVYSTILSNDDLVTITGISDCYTYSTAGSIGTITLSDTISFPSNLDTITITDTVSKEFINAFPNWDKMEKMRKEYPSLDIAMKKLEEVYKMVEDDWKAQQGQKYGSNRS